MQTESVDISESGIRFRSDSEFPEESSVSVSLSLDEEEETVEVPLAAQARVARCHTAEEGSGYDVGIEFFELSDEAKARLSTVLQKMNAD
jgi:c-di-GMP-binding flagellar brake protein YcgR